MVQTALRLAQGPVRIQLIESIGRSIPNIPDKRIRQRWEQILKEAQEGGSTKLEELKLEEEPPER